MKRDLQPKDVVRIAHPQCQGETGVVNRICSTTGMVSVFRTKHDGFATWFNAEDLKRIGRVTSKEKKS